MKKILIIYLSANALIFLALALANLFLVEGKNWIMPSINTDIVSTILLFCIAGMCGFGLFITIKIN